MTMPGRHHTWVRAQRRLRRIALAAGDGKHAPDQRSACRNLLRAELRSDAAQVLPSAKHLGIPKPKSSLTHPRFKRLMDGTVVDRRTGEVVR